MTGLQFKAKVIYGHCDVRAWLEWDGRRLVGMGSITTYDEKGRVVDHKVGPTGLTQTPR